MNGINSIVNTHHPSIGTGQSLVRELKIVGRLLNYGLLCRTMLPKTQKLKTTHIYHLKVSVGLESWHGLGGFSTKLLIRFQLGLSSHLKVNWKRVHFQVHVTAVTFQVLASCWTVGLSFLLAGCQSFPSVPLPCALFFSAAPNMVACCFKAKRKESFIMTVLKNLCNVTEEMKFCYLCCILLIRSKSQVSPKVIRSELHKGMNTRRNRSWRPASLSFKITVCLQL